MRFFDSHCHFDFPEFDADRAAVWQKAQAHRVYGLAMPGVYPAQWERLVAMTLATPDFYFSLGIHPCWIYQVDVSQLALAKYTEQIENLLASMPPTEQYRFVAIGECGLDKTIELPLVQQQEIFAWHIQLANHWRKPLMVHSLKTHNELIALCKKNKPRYGGVVHAFSGSYDTAMQLIDMGFYLGAGGTITYERAQKTRATFSRVPCEAIVLETDGPDMPLCGQQGQRNDPCNTARVAQVLAELRGENVEALAAQLWENTCRLFQLPGAPITQ
ncbi:TatD family deoxyribonuclease [Cellvibrio sp. KY-GH-1]|uniref:TatD family hydrolase n=1 Tax=Cellvibrio sp. KY-GH-1 TaxID=2303332 RepID=UPI001245F9D2|nr:TatD family hydrolase [Cellvibrio sp. KY-GH-1]QEY16411.1 TatD family deoxyribonuclease [Cellvibrio sp. KY-GH-1]